MNVLVCREGEKHAETYYILCKGEDTGHKWRIYTSGDEPFLFSDPFKVAEKLKSLRKAFPGYSYKACIVLDTPSVINPLEDSKL